MLQGVLAVSIFWGTLGYLAYSSGAYNGLKSSLQQQLKGKQKKLKKKINWYQRYVKSLIKRQQIKEDSDSEENIRNDNTSLTQKSQKLEQKVGRENQLQKTKPIHKSFKGRNLTEYREWMSNHKNRDEGQRRSEDEEQKVMSSSLQKILPDDINDEILQAGAVEEDALQKEEPIKYNPFVELDDCSQI